jgi:hypothetical protein
MECPLWRLLISSRSVSKHGHHMQFLFLIGRFLNKSSPLKLLSHMNRNLVGSIYMYGRFCIKFPQSRMKCIWVISLTEGKNVPIPCKSNRNDKPCKKWGRIIFSRWKISKLLQNLNLIQSMRKNICYFRWSLNEMDIFLH